MHIRVALHSISNINLKLNDVSEVGCEVEGVTAGIGKILPRPGWDMGEHDVHAADSPETC